MGGSLSGLIYGIVLKHAGHDVRILERIGNALLAEQGAGLGVAYDLERFMTAYDTLEVQYTLLSPKALVVDRYGHVITTLRPGVQSTSWNTLYYKFRSMFDGLQSLHYPTPPPRWPRDGMATYQYGRIVDCIHDADHGLVVQHRDAQGKLASTAADLVIGADGAGSTVRRMLEPDVQRRYVGYCAWRGTVREQDLVDTLNWCHRGVDRHCQIDRGFFLS